MNITYSKATIDDAYGIEYVASHSWQETYSGLLPESYLNDRIENIANRAEKTKEFLKSYTGTYIVAKNQDKIIGILAYSDPKDDKYSSYGHIGALYLLKEYQGLGIGKELFKIAVQGLKDLGYSKIQLECMQGNKTINFYIKYLGTITETIDYPIKDYIVKADIILFEDIDRTLELLSNEKELLSKNK